MKKSLIILSAILMEFCLLSCDQKISHAEHVWGGQKVTKEATCTEEGEAIVKCACGETKTITLEKLGHNIVEEVVIEPTYLKKGRIDYKCSRCDAAEIKKSVETDRLSLAGQGYEFMKTIEDGQDTIGRYGSFVFGDNDSVVWLWTETYIRNNVPFYLTWDEGQYFIMEEGEKDNPRYKIVLVSDDDAAVLPIREENGKIIISNMLWWDDTVEEYYLSKDFKMSEMGNTSIYLNGAAQESFTDRYGVTCWRYWEDDHCSYIVWNNPCITDVTQTILESNVEAEAFIAFNHQKDKNGKCVNCGKKL